MVCCYLNNFLRSKKYHTNTHMLSVWTTRLKKLVIFHKGLVAIAYESAEKKTVRNVTRYAARQKFVTYSSTEGRVAWQDSIIICKC